MVLTRRCVNEFTAGTLTQINTPARLWSHLGPLEAHAQLDAAATRLAGNELSLVLGMSDLEQFDGSYVLVFVVGKIGWVHNSFLNKVEV